MQTFPEPPYEEITHRVIQCRGCETLTTQILITDPESMVFDDEEGEYVQTYRVDDYPPRQAGRRPLKDQHYLPVNVRTVYTEVLSALFGNMRMLAATGLRTLVEAICNEREARGRTLWDKINELQEMHVLTPDGATILHNVRALGNAAAHEAGLQRISELWDALDVVEHTMTAVYILPGRAERRKK